MLKVLRHAKNAKNQRVLLITIKNFTSIIIKGMFSYFCSYTGQVEEITLPCGSIYNISVKSKVIDEILCGHFAVDTLFH